VIAVVSALRFLDREPGALKERATAQRQRQLALARPPICASALTAIEAGTEKIKAPG